MTYNKMMISKKIK